MNLINQLVSNARYGTGTITSIESDIMTVQFAEKSCKYKYPDAFQKHLILEDESLQAEMNAIATKAVEEKELADKKEKERKIKEAIASIEEAKQSGKQDAPKKKTAPQKRTPPPIKGIQLNGILEREEPIMFSREARLMMSILAVIFGRPMKVSLEGRSTTGSA